MRGAARDLLEQAQHRDEGTTATLLTVDAAPQARRLSEPGVARKVAAQTVDGKCDALLGARILVDLFGVADAFRRLQQLRHEADYDLASEFRRRGVLADIEHAQSALHAVVHARRSHPAELRALVLARCVAPAPVSCFLTQLALHVASTAWSPS